jgi:hypothetical protein
MSANMKKMMDKIAGFENYWLNMEKENLVDLPPLHNEIHLEIIGRFPLIYEDLNTYIISNETE